MDAIAAEIAREVAERNHQATNLTRQAEEHHRQADTTRGILDRLEELNVTKVAKEKELLAKVAEIGSLMLQEEETRAELAKRERLQCDMVAEASEAKARMQDA